MTERLENAAKAWAEFVAADMEARKEIARLEDEMDRARVRIHELMGKLASSSYDAMKAKKELDEAAVEAFQVKQ